MPTLTQLSRQIDAALNQFKALDLGMSDEERYPSCGIGGYDPKKKTYPSIYLSGPKDDFMDLPDSGEAVIKYQVTRRSTEETDGKKRHSLTLEVRSIDPKASMKAAEKKKAEGRAVPIKTEMRTGVSALPLVEFLGGRAPAPVLVPLLNGAVGKMPTTIRKQMKSGKKLAKSLSLKTGDKPPSMDRVPFGFSEFNRPRDGDGQFVANVTGGADPVTMRQAYGPDPAKSKLLAPGAAAAALGGSAALLGTKAGRVMAVKGAKGAARVVRSAVTGIERKAKGRSTERYPIMGSKAPKGKPGFGETLMRQRMRGD